MEGTVDGVETVVGEVLRVGEGGLAHGAQQGEGSVEHDGCLVGTVDILVGVADGDGTDGRGGTAAHTYHRQWGIE